LQIVQDRFARYVPEPECINVDTVRRCGDDGSARRWFVENLMHPVPSGEPVRQFAEQVAGDAKRPHEQREQVQHARQVTDRNDTGPNAEGSNQQQQHSREVR
jgi:hypothetical protein